MPRSVEIEAVVQSDHDARLPHDVSQMISIYPSLRIHRCAHDHRFRCAFCVFVGFGLSEMAPVQMNIDVTKYLKKANFLDYTPHSVSELGTIMMLRLLEEGRDTDVTLVVDEGAECKIRLKAHQSVLAAASPMFRTHDYLHKSGMREGHGDRPQIILTPGGMTLECLELFVVLIYMGDNATKLANKSEVDKHCCALMDKCHHYKVTHLVPTLTASVKRILTLENCWDLFKHTLNLTEGDDQECQNLWEILWHECYKYAFVNFTNIVPPDQSSPDLQAMTAVMHETIMTMWGSTSSGSTRVWRRVSLMRSLESCGSNTIDLEEILL